MVASCKRGCGNVREVSFSVDPGMVIPNLDAYIVCRVRGLKKTVMKICVHLYSKHRVLTVGRTEKLKPCVTLKYEDIILRYVISIHSYVHIS
jgi:hypothetical protein